MYVDFVMCVRKLRIYPCYVHETAKYTRLKTKKSVMSPVLVTFPYISVHCAVKWWNVKVPCQLLLLINITKLT